MAIRLLTLLCLLACAASAQAYTAVRSLEFDAEDFERLRVHARQGDMLITGGAGTAVEAELIIEFDPRWSEEEAEDLLADELVFELFDEGGGLRLNAYLDLDGDLSGWLLGGFIRDVLFSGGGELPRMYLEVSLPASLELEVHDGSGGLRIAGMDGSLAVHDGSGEIGLRDIGGDVVVHDGSGEVEASSIGGDLTIHDGSGSIHAEGVGGFLLVHDGSGEIRLSGLDAGAEIHDSSGGLELDDIVGNVDIRDTSGDIRVFQVDGSVTIRDGSGDIDVDVVASDLILRDGSGDVSTSNIEGRVRRG